MSNFLFLVAILALAAVAYFWNAKKPNQRQGPRFEAIVDNYKSLPEVQRALRRKGLESSNLIVGVDFTKSNAWTGKETFDGRSLHHIDPSGLVMNPYQSAISIIAETLSEFDDDGIIPAFGFGDAHTTDRAVFSLNRGLPCQGANEVLTRYTEAASNVVMSGPTSFAPLIRRAIEIVKETGQYHILLILADGQVTNERETTEAIVAASAHPLSIVMVGLGDGPWDVMEEFDDRLPQRRFDNFQFVNFHQIMTQHSKAPEPAFALAALMEIPQQFEAIRRLGLLGR